MPQLSQAASAPPPTKPTSADIVLLAAAQSAELAVRDVYADAIATGLFSDEQIEVLTMFHDHHTAYAQALNGLLSKSAPNSRNQMLYVSYASRAKSSATAFSALHELENILVSTHTDLLGRLIGLDGAALVASIVIVESRHAAVFGTTPDLNISSALINQSSSLLSVAPAEAVTTTTVAG